MIESEGRAVIPTLEAAIAGIKEASG